MVTVTVLEVEDESAGSPPYTALSEWVPTLNVVTASIPLAAARGAFPIELVPSLKVIAPVAEVGTTVAVSVMACPDTAVAAEAARVTAVVCSGSLLHLP